MPAYSSARKFNGELSAFAWVSVEVQPTSDGGYSFEAVSPRGEVLLMDVDPDGSMHWEWGE